VLERVLWKLSTKAQKARKILKARDLIPEDYVTVKCNKCGRKLCFYPYSVLLPPKCECGNEDSGNCRNWFKGDFGSFRLVAIEVLCFPNILGELQ